MKRYRLQSSRAAGVLAALFSLMCVIAPARADDVNIASVPFYQLVVADPAGHAVQDFVSSQAGTVTLAAADLRTANPSSGLDLLTGLRTDVNLFGGSQPLSLLLSGAGTLTFEVAANQRFATSLYAFAAGPSGFGMASLNLSFAPRVSEVPLPAGIWMLASGLAVMATRARRGRREQSASA